MTAATPVLPGFTGMDSAGYKAALDATAKAYLRLAAAFAPRADVQFAFDPSKVSAAADTVTRENHTLVNDDKVRLSTTGTLPLPLAIATDYFVVSRTDDTFKLAATLGGAAINLTDGGSGIHTLTRTLDMSLAVGAGFVPKVAALPTEVAPQKIGPLTAPAANPRNDIVYIDATTGTAGTATGTEAASPADPAMPAGKIAAARLRLVVGQTQIANSDLDDLRAPWLLGAVLLNAANTFTANQTINTVGLNTLDLRSDVAIGNPSQITFTGKNSAAAFFIYNWIQSNIINATAGAEASRLDFQTRVAGANQVRLAVQNGIMAMTNGLSPTGGDKGAGTINASAVYDDGVLLTPGTFTAYFESAAQTITAAGALTIAHGLGGAPKGFEVLLKCVTAEGGYSAGDLYYEFQTSGGLASQGVAVTPDATNLNVRYGSLANVFQLKNKTTGTGFNITLANWNCIFRAWL